MCFPSLGCVCVWCLRSGVGKFISEGQQFFRDIEVLSEGKRE